MKKLLILFLMLPFLSMAQQTQGIQFVKGLNWNQVKAKAKLENKYIFLDVNATWCAPCRKMEKEVFPLMEVGKVYNERFISVSVQADRTEKDGDNVKAWYEDAASLMKRYSITSIPTYIFFSPSGELIHRSSGYQSKEDFIKLANTALDPERNYHSQKALYYKGALNPAQKLDLIKMTLKSADRLFGDSLARDYIKNYLNNAPASVLMSRDNLSFIKTFGKELVSSDSYFKFLYNHQAKMDSAFGVKSKGVSRSIVNGVVIKEEITQRYWNGSYPKDIEPIWIEVETEIKGKYPEASVAEIVSASKINWYKAKKDWQPLIKEKIKSIERNGLDKMLSSTIGAASINNFVFGYVFKYGTDPNDLNKARQWIEKILVKWPDRTTELDTYANVLYKLGLTKKAIETETKALQIAMNMQPGSERDRKIKLYESIIAKMNAGQPTW